MANLQKLPAFNAESLVHVVVEASHGMTVKCKYDPEHGLFVLGKPLPHGLVYPYDWGFIPGTLGDDGDPLDALVLHDAACPVGCLIECKPVAVLEIEQREKGKTVQRNDRFLLIPGRDKAIKKDVLTARLKRELEQFFQGVVLGSGKSLTLLEWRGRAQAENPSNTAWPAPSKADNHAVERDPRLPLSPLRAAAGRYVR